MLHDKLIPQEQPSLARGEQFQEPSRARISFRLMFFHNNLSTAGIIYEILTTLGSARKIPNLCSID